MNYLYSKLEKTFAKIRLDSRFRGNDTLFYFREAKKLNLNKLNVKCHSIVSPIVGGEKMGIRRGRKLKL